jgi:hypothetical protein
MFGFNGARDDDAKFPFLQCAPERKPETSEQPHLS